MTNAVQIVNGLPKSLSSSNGDIADTSFAGANNQSSAADVTGLSFDNSKVRAFMAIVSVYLNATTSKYETIMISGVQKGAEWDISSSFVGDDSGVDFSITNAGQVQYTSGNATGFSALTIRFRAIALAV